MKLIAVFGCAAAFFAGIAVALLLSYPVPAETIYLGFLAIFAAVVACLFAAAAIALYATKRERVRVDRIVEVTVDRLLHRRGLELVDPD